MREDEFWELIDLLDWESAHDDEQIVEPLVRALTFRVVTAIEGFEETLSTKLFLLDTQGHARSIGEDAYQGPDVYFSHDLFLYARCAVVANGRRLFDEVANVPARFPKDVDFEPLLYVSGTAYERVTGKPFEFVPSVNCETGSNRRGWEAG